MTKIDICETQRNNLIAAACAYQQCTGTDGTEVLIPGGDKRILIGGPAYLARVAAPASADNPPSTNKAVLTDEQIIALAESWDLLSIQDGGRVDRAALIGFFREAAVPASAENPSTAGAPKGQRENKELARILFGMIEGGAVDRDTNIYADDYQAGDGDTYVYRAAEVLVEQDAEIDMLIATINLLSEKLVAAPALNPSEVKDAERYRYLRDHHIGDDPESINLDAAKKPGLDAAVDAAIRALRAPRKDQQSAQIDGGGDAD